MMVSCYLFLRIATFQSPSTKRVNHLKQDRSVDQSLPAAFQETPLDKSYASPAPHADAVVAHDLPLSKPRFFRRPRQQRIWKECHRQVHAEHVHVWCLAPRNTPLPSVYLVRLNWIVCPPSNSPVIRTEGRRGRWNLLDGGMLSERLRLLAIRLIYVLHIFKKKCIVSCETI